MKKINVGVIGAGRIGKIHANNLKYHIPGVKLLAISDMIIEPAKQLAQELEIPIVESDYHRILENKDIEAIIICSSTDSHAQIICEAASAGKHIFCEKPIALDMNKINQALAVVNKSKVKLQIGFNRRFDPSFKKAKELIAAGAIGKPQLLRISSRDPKTPPINFVKSSGGLFLDMMIHDFDMARYLMGEEAVELMATGNCLIDPAIGELGDIDTAVVVLKFQSGAIGTIDNSRQAIYGYDQRIEVFGSEGSVLVGNRTPTEVTLSKADSIQKDKPLYFFLERYQEAFKVEMNHFISCLIERKEPSVSGSDGKISAIMGYAAKESLSKGTFVKINQK